MTQQQGILTARAKMEEEARNSKDFQDFMLFRDSIPRLMADFALKAVSEEREKLAQWMVQNSFATGHGDSIDDLLAELSWQVKELKTAVTQREQEIVRKLRVEAIEQRRSRDDKHCETVLNDIADEIESGE